MQTTPVIPKKMPPDRRHFLRNPSFSAENDGLSRPRWGLARQEWPFATAPRVIIWYANTWYLLMRRHLFTATRILIAQCDLFLRGKPSFLCARDDSPSKMLSFAGLLLYQRRRIGHVWPKIWVTYLWEELFIMHPTALRGSARWTRPLWK